jgi:biotin--protein ligase
MIFIYSDTGVSAASVEALCNYYQFFQKVTCVSGADLRDKQWMRTATLLIIPGGRSLPFYEALGKPGNQNIIDFVTQGGCYLGLCAGAYYACQDTVFAQGLPLALQLPGTLNFFGGTAIGPVFLTDHFAYQSEQGACLADVTFHHQKNDAFYFNGGCYFDRAHDYQNTEILAMYTACQQPAIIACTVGSGRAVLSGVHPELTAGNAMDRFLTAIERPNT